MGLCASVDDRLSPAERAAKSEADARSQALTQGMEKDHKADLRVNKLLLLGAGESGKSTLFKQMITIYKTGFSEQDRKTFVPIIHNNVLSSIKALCMNSANYAKVASEAEEAKNYFISDAVKVESEEIDVETGEMVKLLWKVY